jgi:hypothetical protein
MRKLIATGFCLASATVLAATQGNPYAAAAPWAQYLIVDPHEEVALARTAAPPSISDQAEVMVLTGKGYVSAAKGTNGFMCLVERGWGAQTTDAEFWNPKVRSPICFNAAASKSFAPIYLMKTRLVLAGKSKAEVAQAIAAALESGALPALDPGAMCYMMSPRQYLNDTGVAWHPHLMFFVPGAVQASWGADLKGSPVLSTNDPEERATIFMVPVAHWADGTPAQATH